MNSPHIREALIWGGHIVQPLDNMRGGVETTGPWSKGTNNTDAILDKVQIPTLESTVDISEGFEHASGPKAFGHIEFPKQH